MARAKKNDSAPETAGADPRQAPEAVSNRAETTRATAVVRIFAAALARDPNVVEVVRSGSGNGARRMRQAADLRKVEAKLASGVRVNRVGATVPLSAMQKLKLESQKADLERKIRNADSRVRHGVAVETYSLDDLAGALRVLIARGKLNRQAVEAHGFPQSVLDALDAE